MTAGQRTGCGWILSVLAAMAVAGLQFLVAWFLFPTVYGTFVMTGVPAPKLRFSVLLFVLLALALWGTAFLIRKVGKTEQLKKTTRLELSVGLGALLVVVLVAGVVLFMLPGLL